MLKVYIFPGILLTRLCVNKRCKCWEHSRCVVWCGISYQFQEDILPLTQMIFTIVVCSVFPFNKSDKQRYFRVIPKNSNLGGNSFTEKTMWEYIVAVWSLWHLKFMFDRHLPKPEKYSLSYVLKLPPACRKRDIFSLSKSSLSECLSASPSHDSLIDQ